MAGGDQLSQFRDLTPQPSKKLLFMCMSDQEESFSDDDEKRINPKSSGEESVDDHSQTAAAINEFPRICKVCKKGFSSGKALGGHSRIHAQPPKKQSHLLIKKHLTGHLPPPGTPPTTTTSADCCNTCSVCGKSFPSEKSLFGHMRCHPDRNWRGIQPPLPPPPTITTTSTTANKNSSSSTLSEAEAMPPIHKMDDHIDSATTTTTIRPSSVVDLAESLPGWPSTARRGRKSTLSHSCVGSGLDEHIPEDVVRNLMMLAQGHQDSLNSGLPSNKHHHHHQRVDVSNMMPKKKKRKLKLRDLDTIGGLDHQIHHKNINPTVITTPNRYECTTCNKSFTTHQALGGHRSSHNKLKIIPALIKNESTYAVADSLLADAATAQVGETEEYDHHEEAAASSRLQQEGAFATGQASGCHCTVPVEAPSSQVASSGEASHTGRRITDFDLNELPAMEEEEEGVESAFDQPQHSAG